MVLDDWQWFRRHVLRWAFKLMLHVSAHFMIDKSYSAAFAFSRERHLTSNNLKTCLRQYRRSFSLQQSQSRLNLRSSNFQIHLCSVHSISTFFSIFKLCAEIILFQNQLVLKWVRFVRSKSVHIIYCSSVIFFSTTKCSISSKLIGET